jgi:hypothetical protein
MISKYEEKRGKKYFKRLEIKIAMFKVGKKTHYNR